VSQLKKLKKDKMDKKDPSNTEPANKDFSKAVQAVAASTKGPAEDPKSKKGFERSAARKKNKAADKQKQAILEKLQESKVLLIEKQKRQKN
jgi:hypothetical protein